MFQMLFRSLGPTRALLLIALAISSGLCAWGCGTKGDAHVSTTPWQVAFSPDGGRVAIAYGNWFEDTLVGHGMIIVLDSKTLEQQARYESNLPVQCLAWSQDGKKIVFGTAGDLKTGEGTVEVWNTDEKVSRLIYKPEYSVAHVQFFPKGEKIGVGFSAHKDCATFRIVGVEKGDVIPIASIKKSVTQVIIDKDKSFAAVGCSDGVIWLVNLTDPKEPKALMGHKKSIVSFRFIAEGDVLLSGSRDATIKTWDIKSRECIKSADVSADFSSSWIRCTTFFPNGKFAAVGSDGAKEVAIVDIASGKTLRRFEGHSEGVVSISVSTDGKRLCSTSDRDETIRLWDAESGKELGIYPMKK